MWPESLAAGLMWWLSLAHWVWAQFQTPFWAEALPLVQVMVQLLP